MIVHHLPIHILRIPIFTRRKIVSTKFGKILLNVSSRVL